jgi:hypothetical protein
MYMLAAQNMHGRAHAYMRALICVLLLMRGQQVGRRQSNAVARTWLE